jgi:hypothetical protein
MVVKRKRKRKKEERGRGSWLFHPQQLSLVSVVSSEVSHKLERQIQDIKPKALIILFV